VKTPKRYRLLEKAPLSTGAIPSLVTGRTITEFDLPMSLRTADGEAVYQQSKINDDLLPLWLEDTLHSFKHWYIIANRFPYDSCYKTSHMLLPKSMATEYAELPRVAKTELRKIIDGYCQEHYHQVVENMAVRRSVRNIYHLHLVTFVDSRMEFRT
jgi:hypothetical protein